MKQLNCPNCGAPITGIKCEYCGTQFFNIADMELYKASYLRMKTNGNICTFKAIPVMSELTMDYSGITVNIELKVLNDEEGIYFREVQE